MIASHEKLTLQPLWIDGRLAFLAGFILLYLSIPTYGLSVEQEPRVAPPQIDASIPDDFPGVHNAVAYAPGLISGSVPEGEAGFETLAAMGVKTIISVDGAEPDVKLATAHGLRYVHLPIGYNGMDRQRTLEIARAIQVARERDPGAPIYLHCHHGKHRSAGALGAAAVSLGLTTPEQAKERMKVSGTSPSYTGLYRCVADARPAGADELAAISTEFPAVWKTSGLVKSMVEVDEIYEHLRIVEKSGWKAPKDHPDLVPAAEAGRLADLYRHLLDDERVRRKPIEFREWLEQSSVEAALLESGLIQSTPNPEELTRHFGAVTASCKSCHTKYRD